MATDAKLNAGHGYAQLELNNCAFRRDGRIEAQCKMGSGIDSLENGLILAIDDSTRTVEYPAATSEMFGLNYTSEYMYDERLAGGLSKFVLEKGTFLPRLGYLAVGDKFTTNAVIYDSDTGLTTMKYGYIKTGDNGYIRLSATAPTSTTPTGIVGAAPVLKVIDAAATMPDGSPAVKFRCIKA